MQKPAQRRLPPAAAGIGGDIGAGIARHARADSKRSLNCLCNRRISEAHSKFRYVTNAPQSRQRRRPYPSGSTVMLLSFIIARFKAKPAYVWKPALTLTDSRIVSELTGAAN